MSQRRTHYAMPMTMGRSICPVGKAVVYSVGGGTYAGAVHASTVDLVGTIEETTCKLCRRIYHGTKDGEPALGCVCAEDWTDDGRPVHADEEPTA